MPRKIKENKKEVKIKNNILNANNIHYFFFVILIVIICTCTLVGIVIYNQDKSHPNASNAIIRFEYSEKNEQGYDVYTVREFEDKKVYSIYNSNINTKQKRWSRNKFLDFNEEVYSTKILDSQTQDKEQNSNNLWSLEIELLDGTIKYYSDSSQINKSDLAQIIQKYFEREIRYK